MEAMGELQSLGELASLSRLPIFDSNAAVPMATIFLNSSAGDVTNRYLLQPDDTIACCLPEIRQGRQLPAQTLSWKV